MKKYLIIASFLGVIAMLLGAFGAHGLKEKLTTESLKSFETAVDYQMYHVLAILFVNSFKGFSDTSKTQISLLFIIGTLLFSGSIYLIIVGNIPAKSIWFVTPLGGLLLISGWLLLVYSTFKLKE